MVVIKRKFLKLIILILIFAVVIAIFTIPDKIQKIIYKKEYSEFVSKYAHEYNVDENLVYAVIKAESNFNPDARSSKSAIGIMQLMENTAKDVARKIGLEFDDENIQDELKDVETNIMLGTKYLAILLEKYNNVGVAVTAYNAGIGTVDNWIEKGVIQADGSDLENVPYKETNVYVRKILRDYRIYSEK